MRSFPLAGVYVNFPIDTKPTYVQQWGLSYQVQVSGDWLLSANYLGNKSTHLWSQYDANHAHLYPGQLRRQSMLDSGQRQYTANPRRC